MKQSLSIAFIVAAALASGTVLAQDKAAAAKAAAKSTQVAQAGAAATTTAGSASTGAATTAAGAAANFGTAVISAVPHIGIAAGMTAVGSAASDQGGAATQH